MPTSSLLAKALLTATLMGKLPMGILEQSGHVPVFLIAGRISDREELLNAGFARVECINPPDLPLEEALRKEVACRHIYEMMCNLALTKIRVSSK